MSIEIDPNLERFRRKTDHFVSDVRQLAHGDRLRVDLSFRFRFTLARSVGIVWNRMKDFNLWMDDLEFDSVAGDSPEGSVISFSLPASVHEWYNKTYGPTSGLDAADFRKELFLRRMVPRELLVWEAYSELASDIQAYYTIALGASDSHTVVTGLMAHAPVWADDSAKDAVLQKFNTQARDVAARWTQMYIPRLRYVVEEVGTP